MCKWFGPDGQRVLGLVEQSFEKWIVKHRARSPGRKRSTPGAWASFGGSIFHPRCRARFEVQGGGQARGLGPFVSWAWEGEKILKLFDFYATLAEQATNLIKFALSTQSRTQCLFQGAAVPPKPRPETLRRFKDIPDQLNEIFQESDFSSARGWQELLAAVDEELQDQESAGFKALGVLINDFVAGRPEASKARLEDVKRMIPQKFEARELVDTAFQAWYLHS